MNKNTKTPTRRIALIRTMLGRQGISSENLVLLQHGSYGNANVYRYSDGNPDLAVKEFYSRTWLIRNTLGRFFIHREMKALRHLKNNPGIPLMAQRLGPCALCYAFIQGETLGALRKKKAGKLPKAFFIELEMRVKQMHQAGFAHLDTRNLGNIIQGPDGQPFLIDFQSCVGTRHFPRKILTIVEEADLSGIYKSWNKLCEEPLDGDRAAFLEMVNRRRRLWIFKGYAFKKAIRWGEKRFRARFWPVFGPFSKRRKLDSSEKLPRSA